MRQCDARVKQKTVQMLHSKTDDIQGDGGRLGVGKGMKETEDQETGKRWNVRVDSTMRG